MEPEDAGVSGVVPARGVGNPQQGGLDQEPGSHGNVIVAFHHHFLFASGTAFRHAPVVRAGHGQGNAELVGFPLLADAQVLERLAANEAAGPLDGGAAEVVPRGIAPARAAEGLPRAAAKLLLHVQGDPGHGVEVLPFLPVRQFVDAGHEGGELDGPGIMHPRQFRQDVEILAVRVFQRGGVLGAAGEVAAQHGVPLLVELVLEDDAQVGIRHGNHLVVDEGGGAELAEGGIGVAVGVKIIRLVHHARDDGAFSPVEGLQERYFRQEEDSFPEDVRMRVSRQADGVIHVAAPPRLSGQRSGA